MWPLRRTPPTFSRMNWEKKIRSSNKRPLTSLFTLNIISPQTTFQTSREAEIQSILILTLYLRTNTVFNEQPKLKKASPSSDLHLSRICHLVCQRLNRDYKFCDENRATKWHYCMYKFSLLYIINLYNPFFLCNCVCPSVLSWYSYRQQYTSPIIAKPQVTPYWWSTAVFLNGRAAARYLALVSIILGRERFSWKLSF
jgi:hypothetical protein